MKPFYVLIGSFVVIVLISKYADIEQHQIFAGNASMSIMLLFTAMGHFKFKKGMELMIPPRIPFKRQLVSLTGVFEILAAIGLSFEQTRFATALLLIFFFLAVLPANVYTSRRRINYEKGDNSGPGPNYLWFRLPFQFFLIAWVWYFSIHSYSTL
ncbi:hypothetical protein C7T94_17105 [Pedobacter yulinensis]|uniref:DoxX family protein n=1 Tax=Pedobacter yulinensis TaxID=2126353 RepID=A0A2T3HHK3_9SPHI|nr:hypothetical protein [Pedobacter yulinensis]PST81912.1 hypothetical protein C7T94_17105 [Pedobacter yulinensis]